MNAGHVSGEGWEQICCWVGSGDEKGGGHLVARLCITHHGEMKGDWEEWAEKCGFKQKKEPWSKR